MNDRTRSATVPPPPIASGRAPEAIRDLNLGIDFGTAFSKLILRDLSMPGGRRYSFAVAPQHCNQQLMAPSVVAEESGRLFFGPDADARGGSRGARVYRSLKARSSLPEGFFGVGTPLPEGLESTDLSALFVTYLLQQGHRAALRYSKNKGARLRMGFTLGAPVSCLENEEISSRFLKLAVSAHRMFSLSNMPDLSSGILVSDAMRLIALAGPETVDTKACGAVEDWLRAETLSALMWAYESPTTAPGLYAAVDIGGGTTNASFFKITEAFVDNSWVKSGIAFFGAASSPPGLDKLDLVISNFIGGNNPAELRGMEGDIIAKLADSMNGALSAVYSEYCDAYKRAFRSAYTKEPRQTVWETYELFLIGGGSRVRPVCDCLQRCPPAMTPLRFTVNLASLGSPTDLHLETGEKFVNEIELFHVAYGLSYPRLEIAEYTGPDQIAPVKASDLLPRIFTHPDPWEEGL